MNKILVVITAFSLGYVLNDLTEGNVQLIPEAQAEISSYDIQKAVREGISGHCWVSQDTSSIGQWIYC